MSPSKSFLMLVLLTMPLASCRDGPSAVEQPSIDPSSAGSLAMELYDTNGDGRVAAGELEKAPGLKSALPRLDANGDKSASADEVGERVKGWQAMRTGLVSFSFTVTLDGRPIENATVVFEPEPFLGDDIKKAVATTDGFGGGGPSVPKELRPRSDTPSGVAYGLYQVKVSKVVDGKETIPRKYNEETILGQEVAHDVPEIANRRVSFALTSK